MVDVTFSNKQRLGVHMLLQSYGWGRELRSSHRVAVVGFSLSVNLVAHSGDDFWYSSTLVGGQCRTSDLVRFSSFCSFRVL